RCTLRQRIRIRFRVGDGRQRHEAALKDGNAGRESRQGGRQGQVGKDDAGRASRRQEGRAGEEGGGPDRVGIDCAGKRSVRCEEGFGGGGGNQGATEADQGRAPEGPDDAGKEGRPKSVSSSTRWTRQGSCTPAFFRRWR